MSKIANLGLLAAALLVGGCASTYEYNAQTGQLKIKSRKSVGEVDVKRNKETGEFELKVKSVSDPINEAVGEAIKGSLGNGGG